MNGSREERYGERIIADLAEQLTAKYGSGFDKRSLYRYVKFYHLYPEIVATLRPQSLSQEPKQIVATVSPQSGKPMENIVVAEKLLSWSHYRVLLQVDDPKARSWYEREAFEQVWSVRTLQRNISTQYYERLLSSRDKKPVEEEMRKLTCGTQISSCS